MGFLNQIPQWRVNYVDPRAHHRAPRLVEEAFHRNLHAQMTREKLETALLSRAASLSEEGMQKLLDLAERLRDTE
jgi:hypothetical protein